MAVCVVFVAAVLGLVVVIVGPRNLTLKFGQNGVRSHWLSSELSLDSKSKFELSVAISLPILS